MFHYLIRRLLLLPLTLFCIILVTFVIINLAPGDPVTITEISPDGMASRSEGNAIAFGSDERYLQFREHYGLTLPILLNTWPFLDLEYVKKTLSILMDRGDMSVKKYDALRVLFGDQSRYLMSQLLNVLSDEGESDSTRQMASRFFVRGGTHQAYLGPNLKDWQKTWNRKIANDNHFLRLQVFSHGDTQERIDEKTAQLKQWYQENKEFYHYKMTRWERAINLFHTRFTRYITKVLTLDFGTLRNDNTKTVISEVTKRFKYSLTLSVLPMIVTFALCQCFGFTMAYTQNKWPDIALNIIFLVLYAIPIFVVAPFLIEKVALNGHFPFTNIPIPLGGFTSNETEFLKMTSQERLLDILKHIALPLVAIMYGSLAASSRLSRTAVLEVLRQDYVRTARAKGLSPFPIMYKHVGRNAAITIVTSIAGSLGIILGGSLIVEILFEINGFGKFFYEAVLNRDYNVIMFSALAGSFLTLMGYLVADITYTILDPRVTLE